MDLPEHLRGLFKIFEAHGASLRQRFPGLKRSIKYDDAGQSLCMDVKIPDKAKWHRVREPEMREIAGRYAARSGAGEPLRLMERKRKIGGTSSLWMKMKSKNRCPWCLEMKRKKEHGQEHEDRVVPAILISVV